MKYSFVLILAAFALSFSAQKAEANLTTVSHVDLSRYAGTWFQMARNPHPFEAGCVCARQILTPANDGRIEVFNTCNNQTVNGPIRSIRGYATNDDSRTNARFTVDFGLPRKGAYWIIGLDPQYRYAVVSEPSKESLYILSKTPELSPELYAEALAKAAEQLDTSRVTRTLQQGCTYP